jgi:hypothetical protein
MQGTPETRREQLRQRRQAYCQAATYREQTEEVINLLQRPPTQVQTYVVVGPLEAPKDQKTLVNTSPVEPPQQEDEYPCISSMLLGVLIGIIMFALVYFIVWANGNNL